MSEYAHPETLVSTDWVASHATDPNVRVVEVDVDTRAYDEGHVLGAMAWAWNTPVSYTHLGDLYTMSPYEAALACRLLQPKKVIPMHFGTFPALTGTPEQLHERLSGLNIEVWELKPGQPVEW